MVGAGTVSGAGKHTRGHSRWAPLFACLAQAQIVRQVRDDLPLRDNVLVPRDEGIADVDGDCGGGSVRRQRNPHSAAPQDGDDDEDPPLRTPVTGMTSNSFLSQGSKRRVKENLSGRFFQPARSDILSRWCTKHFERS